MTKVILTLSEPMHATILASLELYMHYPVSGKPLCTADIGSLIEYVKNPVEVNQRVSMAPKVTKPILATPKDVSGPWRLIEDHEQLQAGDEYLMMDGVSWGSIHPDTMREAPTPGARRVNLGTADGRRDFPGRAEQIQFRRRITGPQIIDEQRSPGEGYRFLEDHEIIATGDEQTRFLSYRGEWQGAIPLIQESVDAYRRSVGDNVDGRHDPVYFRRRLQGPEVPLPAHLRDNQGNERGMATPPEFENIQHIPIRPLPAEVDTDVGAGWRRLLDNEIICEGDQYRNTTETNHSFRSARMHFGRTVSFVNDRSARQRIYRRRIQ